MIAPWANFHVETPILEGQFIFAPRVLVELDACSGCGICINADCLSTGLAEPMEIGTGSSHTERIPEDPGLQRASLFR